MTGTSEPETTVEFTNRRDVGIFNGTRVCHEFVQLADKFRREEPEFIRCMFPIDVIVLGYVLQKYGR